MGCLTTQRMSDLIKEIPSLQKALSVIDEAIRRYCILAESDELTTEPLIDLDRILVAFNGGKDCTVLLHLVCMVLTSFLRTTGTLRLLHICDPPEESFPEVLEFVEKTKKHYSLECIEVTGGTMRVALEKVVRDHTEVKAILMGTRSGDPNAGWMDYFCHTSGGWPLMDLVVPLLHMNYHEIWTIVAELNIDYCGMYRRGYTSIGQRSNTVPNPFLISPLLHAKDLKDEAQERAGRIKVVHK